MAVAILLTKFETIRNHSERSLSYTVGISCLTMISKIDFIVQSIYIAIYIATCNYNRE